MKVLHVSTHDVYGGAARATFRLHDALRDSNVESRMLVLRKHSDDPSVQIASGLTYPIRLKNKWRSVRIAHCLNHWRTENTVLHSHGLQTAGAVKMINESNADVVNLHWIPGILSIEDIAHVNKPIVWTLHDMWAFCGAEHYTLDDSERRYIEGYADENRPIHEHGCDLNKRIWALKMRTWRRQNFHIVSPSRWLAMCAQESKLFSRCAVHTIPYSIDSKKVWRPVDRFTARDVLHLPLDTQIVLTGAIGGLSDSRKGGDLIHAALSRLSAKYKKKYELAVFGSNKPLEDRQWPCKVHWLGNISDDRLMSLVYSAVDVMVVGSRRENLGQTSIESMACGTPVVAFAIGGNIDIIEHGINGCLVPPYDVDIMADEIRSMLDYGARDSQHRQAARKSVIQKYSPTLIAKQYITLYSEILSLTRL